ncbi:carbon storage regulator CsrA [Legionella beliardensis]|uniref:Carbon storage regulator CsrA n=1 Tax=Legionella beliardensis TaxID=91822 RepID=A0A378I2K2_9GAMM|nr:carbon storage regulator [Legionella beliardensis]STX29172.1 carbon storage regulator CsrA [Legionella beliardensis]
MDILTVNFEEALKITIDGKSVLLMAFKTLEHGNIKFGVEAPRAIKVHREEIYQAIQSQEKQNEAT